MGSWNKLTKSDIARFSGKKYDEYSRTWSPIIEAFGVEKLRSHPWIKESLNQTLSVRKLTPHHLISIASIKNLNKHYFWFMQQTCYSVNHPKNLVLLPNLPVLACELRIQSHHQGVNHISWDSVSNIIPKDNIEKIKETSKKKAIKEAVGYSFYVNGRLRKLIKNKIKRCENYKCRKIVDSLDSLSELISYEITTGKLLLDSGTDRFLPGGCGCSVDEPCEKDRAHKFYNNWDVVRLKGMTGARLKTAHEIYK